RPDSPRRRWLRLYLGLLAASGTVRWFSRMPAPSPDIRFAQLRVVDGNRLGSGKIRLAYRDSAPDSNSLPVVLVHGSPGNGEVFEKLTAILAPRFRVIAPDLPGFGSSTHGLPDYSFRA